MATRKLTAPLSAEEREEFRNLFAKRLENVKARTADVLAFKRVKQPPFIVNSALFTAFGLDSDTFPDDYFDDPAIMTNFQERNCYEQVKAIAKPESSTH